MPLVSADIPGSLKNALQKEITRLGTSESAVITAAKVTADTESQQTGARLVVRALEAQGVSHVFGIPGAEIDAVFNALVDSKIKTVVCRHEQNAAFIAGGIGRMTGKAGVAIATSGPGVSNLVTGLATANSEGDPIVALGGAVDTAQALKQIHQTMDAVSIMKPVTKFSVTVGAPSQVNEALINAFRAAESGRPGAAYVNLPKDIMAAPSDHDTLNPSRTPWVSTGGWTWRNSVELPRLSESPQWGALRPLLSQPLRFSGGLQRCNRRPPSRGW
jgi:TPP-dependent trihydroxycyclohexane-1,2-dione (THcHDO) dehydratase